VARQGRDEGSVESNQSVKEFVRDLRLFYNLHYLYKTEETKHERLQTSFEEATVRLKDTLIKALKYWLYRHATFINTISQPGYKPKKGEEWVTDYAQILPEKLSSIILTMRDLEGTEDKSQLVLAVDKVVHFFHVDKPIIGHVMEYLKLQNKEELLSEDLDFFSSFVKHVWEEKERMSSGE